MKNTWVEARVLDASDRTYFNAVLPLFEKAKNEIVLSFYLIEPEEAADLSHPVNRLVESLLNARRRGVRIRMYLNTNFRFRPKTEVGSGGHFERLIKAGTEIATLLPRRRLHDKLIVIDNRYVVEGSMNWSVSALESNYESVSIIDSPAHAQKKLERINLLMLPPPAKKSEPDSSLLPVPETVEIPAALFEKNRLPKMSQASDQRSLDLYLILLGQAQAAKRNDLELDLETAGHALNFPAEWERSRIRRQVIKVLRKLANHYKLIDVEFPFGKNAQVEIESFPGEKIQVPGRFLEANSLAKESSGVTLLALIREVLKKEGVEIDSLSALEMEKRFGIGASTVIRSRKI